MTPEQEVQEFRVKSIACEFLKMVQGMDSYEVIMALAVASGAAMGQTFHADDLDRIVDMYMTRVKDVVHANSRGKTSSVSNGGAVH